MMGKSYTRTALHGFVLVFFVLAGRSTAAAADETPITRAGTDQLKAWHEQPPAQRREIVVPEKGEVKMDFTLGITGLPKL